MSNALNRVLLLIIIASGSFILPDNYLVCQTVPDSVKIAADTAIVADTALVKEEKEILLPLFSKAFLSSKTGTVLIRKEFQRNDYKYTGDIFSQVPFSFNKFKGSLGQPHELLLYSGGYASNSFLENGIPINSRITNSFDLNNFQTEIIDSIEVVPLSRGFLYDLYNNNTSVNIITRSNLAPKPVTRIRLLQAPNEEGMIDAMFNGYIMKRLNFSFEVTNENIDSTYSNDGYNSWQVFSNLRYLLSNNFNLISTFRYVKSEVKLFGGINNSVSSDIYDEIEAVPNFSKRYRKNSEYHFDVKLLGNIAGFAPFDITVYYKSNFLEFRQNETVPDKSLGIDKFINNNESYTTGLYFRNSIDIRGQKLDLIGRAENVKYKIDALNIYDSRKALSVSGITQLSLFNGGFNPSVFGKYLYYNSRTFAGLGSDVKLNLNRSFELYAGASYFEKPFNRFEEFYLKNTDSRNKNLNFEAGIKTIAKNITAGISFFIADKKNNAVAFFEEDKASTAGVISKYELNDFTLKGLNIDVQGKYSKIIYTLNASLYSTDKPDKFIQTPQFTFTGGVYYTDTLFNSNLDLKAGFNFYSAGEQNPYVYDYQQDKPVFFQYNQSTSLISKIYPENVKPYFITDLFISGVVQKKAIIYFVFENLFDIKYYIVPYYPAHGRSMRFGISWEFTD